MTFTHYSSSACTSFHTLIITTLSWLYTTHDSITWNSHPFPVHPSHGCILGYSLLSFCTPHHSIIHTAQNLPAPTVHDSITFISLTSACTPHLWLSPATIWPLSPHPAMTLTSYSKTNDHTQLMVLLPTVKTLPSITLMSQSPTIATSSCWVESDLFLNIHHDFITPLLLDLCLHITSLTLSLDTAWFFSSHLVMTLTTVQPLPSHGSITCYCLTFDTSALLYYLRQSSFIYTPYHGFTTAYSSASAGTPQP